MVGKAASRWKDPVSIPPGATVLSGTLRAVAISRLVKPDFDRLYRATYRRVFATLMLILRNPAAAEDATQEAYLRAFRGWGRWKQEAPAEAWIYRIALDVAFTHRRRERLHDVGEVLRRLGRPKETDPTEIGEPDLRREVRGLPPKQAAALVLRHLHGVDIPGRPVRGIRRVADTLNTVGTTSVVVSGIEETIHANGDERLLHLT